MNDVALAGNARPPTLTERLSAGLAPATQRCSLNGWRKWEAFATDHGATTLPADPEALAAFVEHLAAAFAEIPQVRASGYGSTATGRPCSAGDACSSTAAKYPSKSRYRRSQEFRHRGIGSRAAERSSSVCRRLHGQEAIDTPIPPA